MQIDDEEHELTVRPLKDAEMIRIRSKLDLDEMEGLGDELSDTDEWDEYMDLLDKSEEELTDEERARRDELESTLEEHGDGAMEEILSEETYEALAYAAKCAVVPDDADASAVLRDQDLATDFEEKYGVSIKSKADAKDVLNEEIEEMVENATGFVSIAIGVRALTKGVGNVGN